MFSYGNKFRITIYGASHDETMGLIIDGLKPGLTIHTSRIIDDLTKRRPTKIGTTKRIEEDEFVISNGLYNNMTTGGPLHIIIKNKDIVSKDYSNLKKHFRPNHADYTASIKYNGFNDHRGGGFFSGRMTSLLVIAGSIARSILPYKISSKLMQVGSLKDMSKLDNYLTEIQNRNDSVGGIVKLNVTKMVAGIGDPYFDKLDAKIAHLILTVPGVKGIVFGDDFNVENTGSINNDLIVNKLGETKTNYSGGIVGGISNGNDIVFNVLVKPTSSIFKSQETFNFESNKIEDLLIQGRHDVAFVRRIPIVLESVLAICLANY